MSLHCSFLLFLLQIVFFPIILYSSPLLLLPFSVASVRRQIHVNQALEASAMQSSNNSQASVEQETKGTRSDLVPVPPGRSSLLLFHLPACAKWVFGSILFLGIPVYKRVLRIEGVLEKDVLDMAEIVKKVAEVTDKVSSDVAEALPADSNLKKIATEVEDKAEVVCVDVEKIETFIQKVDDIKDESEAWLDKIADEWELIMLDEGSQEENNLNGMSQEIKK